MQGDLEIDGPMGQVGNWFYSFFFFYCLRVKMSLWYKQMFPGKEKCPHLLGPLAVSSFRKITDFFLQW
jgi:hypothetical protein